VQAADPGGQRQRRALTFEWASSGSALGTFAADGDYDSGARAMSARCTPKGAPMSLLISILITFLVVVLVLYLVNMLPIDGRAKQIVRIIVIILGVLSLLKYIAVF
jgi:hypothetical protein